MGYMPPPNPTPRPPPTYPPTTPPGTPPTTPPSIPAEGGGTDLACPGDATGAGLGLATGEVSATLTVSLALPMSSFNRKGGGAVAPIVTVARVCRNPARVTRVS